ncbi:uncharacterized protein LOC128389956 [Panonychus citri]|uniref:uncharacterized protein LOC128389956 n=1 Tax=Panonychus citri TaxID=50023 RepID=UPI002307F22C|nr:uncharacterized protein LOC128389956 [Panonychus citri]
MDLTRAFQILNEEMEQEYDEICRRFVIPDNQNCADSINHGLDACMECDEDDEICKNYYVKNDEEELDMYMENQDDDDICINLGIEGETEAEEVSMLDLSATGVINEIATGQILSQSIQKQPDAIYYTDNHSSSSGSTSLVHSCASNEQYDVGHSSQDIAQSTHRSSSSSTSSSCSTCNSSQSSSFSSSSCSTCDTCSTCNSSQSSSFSSSSCSTCDTCSTCNSSQSSSFSSSSCSTCNSSQSSSFSSSSCSTCDTCSTCNSSQSSSFSSTCAQDNTSRSKQDFSQQGGGQGDDSILHSRPREREIEFEIVDEQPWRTNANFHSMTKLLRARLNNNCSSGVDISRLSHAIDTAYERFVSKLIEDANSNDRIFITFRNPQENRELYVSFLKKNFNPQEFLDRAYALAQSAGNFLDDGVFEIKVQIVKSISGGARARV